MAALQNVGRAAEWLGTHKAAAALMVGAGALAMHRVKPFQPLREAVLQQATGDPFADRKLLSASINTALADTMMPGYLKADARDLEDHYINTGPQSFYDPSYLSYRNSAPSGNIVFGLYNDRLR